MKRNVQPVVCAGCTCLCDDVGVVSVNDRVVETINACELGENWFKQLPLEASFEINGEQVDFEKAVKESAQLLRASKAPLICGLDGLSTNSQIEAVKLAKQFRAAIDTSWSNRHRGGILAMQSVGKVTATLGEISSRADVILFWFCDPATTHPRFFERFCKSAKHIVVIDEKKTETARLATNFIQLDRERVSELLSELRLANSGAFSTEPSQPATALTSMFQNSSYVASIYGALDGGPSHQNLQSLYLLTRELNQRTRAVVVGLRNDANALSAENVLAWNSGFPFGISYAGGKPEFNGLEYSAESVLERSECDLVFACSTISMGSLRDFAAARLRQIPTIVIDDAAAKSRFEPTIRFNVGLESGDWCRLDDVSLPVVRSINDSSSVTSSQVLKAVLATIAVTLTA